MREVRGGKVLVILLTLLLALVCAGCPSRPAPKPGGGMGKPPPSGLPSIGGQTRRGVHYDSGGNIIQGA